MKINQASHAASLGLDHIATELPNKAQIEDSPEAILEASKAFESIFVNELMKSMRKTLPEDGMLNGGFANGVFNGMLDQEYAQIASRSGQFGLANIIAEQLGGGTSMNPAAAEAASNRIVDVDGEEVPAWALEEIQDDPWSPGGGDKIDPNGQVTSGLSSPKNSEFRTQAVKGASQQKAVAAYQNIGRTISHTPAHSDAITVSPLLQKKP